MGNTDYAMNIANKFIGKNIPLNKRVKKLGEEVVELAMAVQKEDYSGHIEEEIGDCAFLLAHMLDNYNSDLSITDVIQQAAFKMKCRKLQQFDDIESSDKEPYQVIRSDRDQRKIYMVHKETAIPKIITYDEAKDYIF